MSQKEKNSEAREPEAAYQTIRIFKSFEEEQEYNAKQSAAVSHEDRLRHAEILRKHVYAQHLQPDGLWPPMSQSFRIMKPYTNDPEQKL